MKSTECVQRAIVWLSIMQADNFPQRLMGPLERFMLHGTAPHPVQIDQFLEFLNGMKIGTAWDTVRDVAELIAKMIGQLEAAAVEAPPAATATTEDWRKAA